MRKLLFVFLAFGSVLAISQDVKTFPFMEAESLTNQFVNLPDDIKGKHSLIGLAFSKRSEKDLKTWFSPIYNQFIYKPETPSLFAGNYDVNVFFIPMFTGAKRIAYQKTMDKVKEDIDPRIQPNVLFYKGSLRDYKDQLDFEGKDVPYFYVLDPEGNIIYSTLGAYSDKKMQDVLSALEDAWGN